MKLVAFALSGGLLLTSALTMLAWADDGLWNKTAAHMAVAQKLVAGDIDLVVTAVKDGAPAPMHLRSHLSGWEKGKPVYTSVVVDAAPGTGKGKEQGGAKLIDALTQMTASLMEPGAKVTRAEGRALDGKTWAIFEAREGSVGRKMMATMWVDADTGCLRRVDTDVHATLMLDGRMTTSYVLDEQGRCLPRQLDADIAVTIPFKGAKMKVTQISSNWVARPASH